jgi:hypothetical protein
VAVESPGQSSPNYRERRFFEAGTWRMEVAGGKDVAAFGADLRIPAAPRFVNLPDNVKLGPEREMLVEWDGALHTGSDRMTVTFQRWEYPDRLVCRVPAWEGRLRLPVYALLQEFESLPAGFWVAGVQLTVEPATEYPQLFPFRLVNGSVWNGIVLTRLSEYRLIRVMEERP